MRIRIVWLVVQILLAESLIIYVPLILFQQYSSIVYSLATGMGMVLAMGTGGGIYYYIKLRRY